MKKNRLCAALLSTVFLSVFSAGGGAGAQNAPRLDYAGNTGRTRDTHLAQSAETDSESAGAEKPAVNLMWGVPDRIEMEQFAGLEKIISQRHQGSSIGFGADVRAPEERDAGAILKDVEPEDLLKFGMIPEFIGRVPVLATLNDLDEEALIQILTEPKNALIKQYKRLYAMESVNLEFTEDALRAIAEQAIARGTGARGLRSILESILLDSMFELPSLQSVEEVVINREVVEGRAHPLYIHSERREDLGTSA